MYTIRIWYVLYSVWYHTVCNCKDEFQAHSVVHHDIRISSVLTSLCTVHLHRPSCTFHCCFDVKCILEEMLKFTIAKKQTWVSLRPKAKFTEHMIFVRI